ncbi:MAG: hypothetical protein RIR53_837 [Bacteroidota bacterium]|jgi:hypothetical protein
MMSTTVYFHPRRTLVATWDTRGTVPCLASFREYAPEDHSAVAEVHSDALTVIVGQDGWFLHSYPCSTDNPSDHRLAFEVQEVCGLPADHRIDLECSQRLRSGMAWSSFIAVRPGALQAHEVTFADLIRADVSVDIGVALACTPPQNRPWALHGRRGDRVITAFIDTDHRLSAIAIRAITDQAPYHEATLAELASVGQRFDADIKHVMLFGDFLTLPMIDDVKAALRSAGIKSTRLQPFRHVESSLDQATASRIIARAHVIAPIMAGILPQLSA